MEIIAATHTLDIPDVSAKKDHIKWRSNHNNKIKEQDFITTV